MSRVQISSPAPFYDKHIHINVVLNRKLEIMAEMAVLAAAMFLAAFFCFRVLLLPKATETTVKKVYEIEEILSQKRQSSR